MYAKRQTAQRIYNGEKYLFDGAEYYKADAEARKGYLKRKGYNVRIVRLEGHYCVYKRKK